MQLICLILITFFVKVIHSHVETKSNKYYQNNHKNNHKSNISNNEQDIISLQYQIIEDKAYDKLITAINNYSNQTNRNDDHIIDQYPFGDLLVAYYIHPIHVHNSDNKGDTEKYFIGIDAIKSIGKKFIVYTAGIAGLPQFENNLTALGATVYGFDCTDYKRNEYLFKFLPWCIGTYDKSFQEDNTYVKEFNKNSSNNNTMMFYTLKEIKSKLNHSKINLLKMDIEGFEWNLLYNEIIHNNDIDSLPEQLLFELHTEDSDPSCIPQNLVKNKKRHQVNILVYKLWLLGYRLVNIDINKGDHMCAELSFVRLKQKSNKKKEANLKK